MTDEERAKLTCQVLDSIFSNYGKWHALAKKAKYSVAYGGGSKYLLPLHVHQQIVAHSDWGALAVAIAEEYLPSLAPLKPEHASAALRIVLQDFLGWPRHAIAQQPEGPAHLALLDALEMLDAEHNNQENPNER